MNRLIILLFSLILFFLPAFGQDLNTDLNRKFTKYSLAQLDSTAILKKVDKNEVALIGIFLVYLETNNLFSNRLIASETPATVKPVKGKLVGLSDSEVRLTIGDKVKGYIFKGQQRYFVEPALRYSSYAKPDDYIIYLDSDVIGASVINLSNDMAVGQKIAESSLQSKRSKNVYAANTTTVKVIEIATDADYEFVQEVGGGTQANNEIVNIINMAEGVYERDLGLTFDIVYQNAWTTPDPYPATDAVSLLDQFKTYWNNNLTHIPRDTAHLFTGVNLAGNIGGSAEQDVICRVLSKAYGFTKRFDFPLTWRIFAHELAHNLAARHADSGDCANTLMNTGISAATRSEFCPLSMNEITSYVSMHGGCLEQISVPKTKFDFDEDGKADLSVFRLNDPITNLATWYVRRSPTTFSAVQFGFSTDKIAPADYDRDGKTDYAVFRDGTWYILRSSDGVTTVSTFGLAGDKPVPADYDNDGKDDLAIFRPSTATWWILRSSSGTVAIQFGNSTDKPVPADYTGDGKTDIAFFRPSTGEWFVLRSEDSSFYSFPFGQNGDIPTSADFNGDKIADYVIFRNGTWYIQYTSGGTTAHLLGMAGDIPVPADYDGDGLADLATFRQGLWIFVNTDVQFGLNGDIPIPGFLVAQ